MDDPVAVFLSFYPSPTTADLMVEDHNAVRALAAHYEAKGMRRAAEICGVVTASLDNRGAIGSANGAEKCQEAITAAASKREADRG